jgi:two-component system sensor histidine kinase PilS (NtrC family)
VNGHTRNGHAEATDGGTTQPYSPSGLLSWFGQSPTGASGLEEQWAQAGLTGWGADAPVPELNGATLSEATRTYKAFLSARLVLALALLAVVTGAQALGTQPPAWMPGVAVAYALATATLRFAPMPWIDRTLRQGPLHTRHLLPSVGLDLAVFAGLHALAASNVNSQALLVLPVLMAAVLAPRILALGTAALATLILLGIALLPANLGSGSASTLLTQAGLTGLGLFVMAVLANELASRLAKEERSARGSLALAQQQAELNGLMIDEMSEGVMVLDRQGRVRAANPAARKLIAAQGLGPSAPFKVRGVPAWASLMQAIEAALNHPELAEHGQDVRLTFDDRQERDLRVRTRFTRSRQRRSEDLCVVLLEDLRTVRARQRQDKLAAMGRMSAGIAHEIRNPLAAIAQANSLLAEDLTTPTQQHLTRMVGDNVQRLNRIIDDILVVAPGVRPPAPVIDPIERTVAIVNEWRSTQGLSQGDDSLLEIDTSGCRPMAGQPAIRARFEPEHLQRIVVNLLDNALRHHSGQPGAIVLGLRWMPGLEPQGLLMISVSSDGDPITAETERALFEPFFSTRSRGTGLGLYICRELCERHGATIDYRLHPSPVRHRNEFYLTVPLEAPGHSG